MRAWLISFAACLLICGCGGKEVTYLDIVHAGSLSVPFERLEAAFEKSHPGVDVRRQAFGSAMAIIQVTELGKTVDVIASADYRLIDTMMIEADPQWARWNLVFARNAMCIALPPGSTRLTADNWTAEFHKSDLRIGASNPNHDPCGYRALMVMTLAEALPGGEGILDTVVTANSTVTVETAEGRTTVSVPADVEFKDRFVVRPKETDLVPLLEAGAIDCLLIYKSVAQQHSMAFVELGDSVNLSLPSLEDDYGKVSVVLNAGKDDAVTVDGGAIAYGVTVPLVAPHKDLALEFVRLLVSGEGHAIVTECGQDPMEGLVYSKASDQAVYAQLGLEEGK